MGPFTRLFVLLAVSAPLTACGGYGGDAAPAGEPGELSSAHRAALADTLRMEADRFVAAVSSLDGEQFARLFTDAPDLTYIDAGNIYADKEALVQAASGFFGRTQRMDAEWDPARVVVLGRDAGVFTGIFHADALDSEGTPTWTDGKAWTFAYRRAPGGGWEIVHAHETNLPPGRIDQYR